MCVILNWFDWECCFKIVEGIYYFELKKLIVIDIYIYILGRKIFILNVLNMEVKINVVFSEYKLIRDVRIRFRMWV